MPTAPAPPSTRLTLGAALLFALGTHGVIGTVAGRLAFAPQAADPVVELALVPSAPATPAPSPPAAPRTPRARPPRPRPPPPAALPHTPSPSAPPVPLPADTPPDQRPSPLVATTSASVTRAAAPAPADAAGTSSPRRVPPPRRAERFAPTAGEDVSAPEVLERFVPRYPRRLREEGIEGTVVLELLVDKRGRVRGTRVVRGVHPTLDRLSRAALKRTRFAPCRRGSEPVDCRHMFRFRWRLGL